MSGLAKKFSMKINLAVVVSILSSVSILACVFLGKQEEWDRFIRILFPLVFWVGLILEQILIWSANSVRKKLDVQPKPYYSYGRIGFLSVFQTDEGVIVDLIGALAVEVFILLLIFQEGKGFTQYFLIFLIVLSVRLHCIFNGKNFKYKKYLAKRKVD